MRRFPSSRSWRGWFRAAKPGEVREVAERLRRGLGGHGDHLHRASVGLRFILLPCSNVPHLPHLLSQMLDDLASRGHPLQLRGEGFASRHILFVGPCGQFRRNEANGNSGETKPTAIWAERTSRRVGRTNFTSSWPNELRDKSGRTNFTPPPLNPGARSSRRQWCASLCPAVSPHRTACSCSVISSSPRRARRGSRGRRR